MADRALQIDCVTVVNPTGISPVVLVCEHASSYIPPHFDNLGLPEDKRKSHVAWDPGALGVAERISKELNAVLVAGGVSRLVYDCNRPPSSPDAMPVRSETVDIPGNAGLSDADRAERVETCYLPFRRVLQDRIAATKSPVIVTIHSFTPIYNGQARSVEIGVLHDTDARLADAMIAVAPTHSGADVQRNQPYGPEHGVTHTLLDQAIPHGHLNVMLEVRNDLVQSETQQEAIGDMIVGWLRDALATLKPGGLAA